MNAAGLTATREQNPDAPADEEDCVWSAGVELINQDRRKRACFACIAAAASIESRLGDPNEWMFTVPKLVVAPPVTEVHAERC